jgi:hypothetical protein
MDTYPPEAWRRLGVVLTRRRGQLGYGFRQRAAFAEANGLKLSAKTLTRLEKAERDGYPEDTLALAEVIYRLKPGSVQAVLAGAEPEFIEDAPERDRGGQDAAVVVLQGALTRFERFIMDSDELTAGEKAELIGAHREFGGEQILQEYRERVRRSRSGGS